jgi:hypothetical protein
MFDEGADAEGGGEFLLTRKGIGGAWRGVWSVCGMIRRCAGAGDDRRGQDGAIGSLPEASDARRVGEGHSRIPTLRRKSFLTERKV